MFLYKKLSFVYLYSGVPRQNIKRRKNNIGDSKWLLTRLNNNKVQKSIAVTNEIMNESIKNVLMWQQYHIVYSSIIKNINQIWRIFSECDAEIIINIDKKKQTDKINILYIFTSVILIDFFFVQ